MTMSVSVASVRIQDFRHVLVPAHVQVKARARLELWGPARAEKAEASYRTVDEAPSWI